MPPARCPRFYAEGVCNIQACPLEHIWRLCSCRKKISAVQFEQHCAGKPHKRALAEIQREQATPQPAAEERLRCDACQLEFSSMEMFALHRQTDAHMRTLRDRLAQHTSAARDRSATSPSAEATSPSSIPVPPPDPSRATTLCDLSKLTDPSDGDDGSVTIEFGVVEVDASIRAANSTVRTVQFGTTRGRFSLLDVSFVSQSAETNTSTPSASFATAVTRQSRVIRPDDPLPVEFKLVNFEEGLHKDVFNINVQNFSNQAVYSISLVVRALVGSKDDYEFLNARRRRPRLIEHIPVPFSGPTDRPGRPAEWTPVNWEVRLPQYPIPKEMETLMDEGKLSYKVFRREFMPSGGFSMHTYDSHFRALSFVAELDERRELMRRGAGSLKIESQYPYYAIRMQGIAERLPNLHVGDFIKVKRIQAAAGDQNFEGRVQRIDLNKVVIHFSDKFRASRHNNDKFDVQFSFNSMPYRRQHRALEFVAESVRLLFPQPGPEARAWRSPVNLLPISPNILDNVEQMQAVKAIVQAPPGSAPFIIFGPPGTGKTSTVVEAIHQLLAKSADVRVLACTPTNTAADVLAIKLATGPAKLEPDVLFRLNAIWRGRGQDLDNVPDTYPNELLDPYSEINENNVFAIPTKEKLGSFRVVVATCASAGVAESLGLPRGHFTHIIIDEAAQCVEPVTNGAILPLADEGTNVVLAGDPKQLGASCHSKLARAFGLKVSYMERLMKRTIYDLRHAEGIRIMKLKKNFRNHPSIIHFSNQVFYEGELQPMGNADVRMLEQAPSVRNKFPVIFHAIVGEEKHEVGSPSYYNESEALVVKRYVDELRDGYTAGGQLIKLDSEDIGIITPYLDQQHVMKDLCGRKGLKIGTVESFQGQERRVIIVSTVRSRNLGFVSEPQRINVALTRARALVIVVGNPLALAEDPYWRTLLLYINQRGGWRGNPRAADIPALTDSVVRAHDEAMMSGSKTAEAKADAADLLKRLRSVIDTIPPPL